METHSSFPSGRRANPAGSIPTAMRRTTFRVLRSITSTGSAGVLATKTWSRLRTKGLECGLRKDGCPTGAGLEGAAVARQFATRARHKEIKNFMTGRNYSLLMASGSNQFRKHPPLSRMTGGVAVNAPGPGDLPENSKASATEKKVKSAGGPFTKQKMPAVKAGGLS